MSNLFRHLPSVDRILAAMEGDPALEAMPRPLLKDLVGRFLDRVREDIKAGRLDSPGAVGLDALAPSLRIFLAAEGRPRFRRVLNATGVVIHTNLGRSILAPEAMHAVADACAHYSNLEFDLDTGKRGSRYSHVEQILCDLTGAEAALVVNNNAAAVLLVLNTLAQGREVVVSRGQLVEIGGSFRIPDVMARSGAVLREVGATNRTHGHDYEQAVNENTAALMKVHSSNFRVVGFTKEVETADLADLAHRFGLPAIEDLGSGNFHDFGITGLWGEPTVQQTVAAGMDVISFSGDKVLGGPQAGIIVGRTEFVERIKKNPMNRALRIDKMTLAALEATLRLYLDPAMAASRVPTLRMILAGSDELRRRAGNLRRRLAKALGGKADISLVPGMSRVGGGSFPERDLPTTLVAVRPPQGPAGISAEALKTALLHTDPPLVGRLEEDAFCLDPRTLEDSEFPLVAAALDAALASAGNGIT